MKHSTIQSLFVELGVRNEYPISLICRYLDLDEVRENKNVSKEPTTTVLDWSARRYDAIMRHQTIESCAESVKEWIIESYRGNSKNEHDGHEIYDLRVHINMDQDDRIFFGIVHHYKPKLVPEDNTEVLIRVRNSLQERAKAVRERQKRADRKHQSFIDKLNGLDLPENVKEQVLNKLRDDES